MTFAEWRQTYPYLRAVRPHADAPEVFLIEGRDPVNQGGPAVFDAPMRELFTLADYRVTSDNPHRGTVWVAPRVERDDWTRDDYMHGRIDHETYYLSLARLIGFDDLARIVLSATSKDKIIKAIASERHLNAIPLAMWDALDRPIRMLVQARNRERGIMARSWCGQPLTPGTICWSMSESVCVAKAVARAIVEEGVS